MGSRSGVLWSSFALLLAVASAHADVFVGRFGAPGDPDVVRVFPDGATGNLAPTRLLGGPATLLQTADALFYEPIENVIYVSDFYGQAVRVFPFGAQGNLAPVRSFSGPVLGQPRGLVVLPAHQEVVVVAHTLFVATFNQFASGTVGPVRVIDWGATTQLNNPVGLAYWPPTDEVFVGESDANGGKILVFPRTASGNVAPSRVISGTSTELGGWVMGLAVHPSLPELYALAGVSGSPNTGHIVTFQVSASGNATPTRVISGPATLLEEVRSLSYDARTDELVALIGGPGGGTPAVLRFPRTAQGDVAPLGNLSGTNTGLSDVGGVLAVAPDRIFRDGFQSGP